MSLGVAVAATTALATGAAADWTETQRLLADDGMPVDEFGFSVFTDGAIALCGAWGNDNVNGQNAGAVYVHRHDGASWVLEQKLIASDGEGLTEYGISVDADGDALIIGTWSDNNENGTAAGAAYVYRFDGKQWNEEQKLIASDGDSNDFFGFGVAIEGNVAIAGALGNENANGYGAGAVYVYRFDGQTWNEEQKLIASDGTIAAGLGVKVGLSGDAIVGGAWNARNDADENSGAAYMYRHDGQQWNEEQKLVAGDGARDDGLGVSVAIDGDVVILGASKDDNENGSNAGAAYVFRYGEGAWTFERKLVGMETDDDDRFGVAVSIDGDACIAGAVGDDNDNGEGAGAAFVFRYDGKNWLEEQTLLGSTSAPGHVYGLGVSISGNDAIVGSPGYEGGTGAAYLFELTTECDPCEGDNDGDCDVDFDDLLLVISNWGPCK